MENMFKYIAIALIFSATFMAIQWLLYKLGSQVTGLSLFDRLKQRYDQDIAKLNNEGPVVVSTQKMQRFQQFGAGFGFLIGLVLMDLNIAAVETYLIAMCTALIGFLTPRYIVKALALKRKKDMERQLPDALELIVNSLRAGLSLLQTLEVVSNESPAPISEEFAAVCRDCRLGLTSEEALEKMLLRWPNQDLELFVIASGVSIRTGGNLAEVAGRMIQTIRERFRLKGRIESLTAQGRMSGWVVGFLPIGLLVALIALEPDMMSAFFQHPLGSALLIGAIILEILGAFFISKIVNIDTRG